MDLKCDLKNTTQSQDFKIPMSQTRADSDSQGANYTPAQSVGCF